MKTKNNKKTVQPLVLAVAAYFLLQFGGMAHGETFCVQTSGGLQSAFATAEGNGEADVIQLVQGTYSGNFTYTAREEHKLSVLGGYGPGCGSRVADPTNTVLDGGSAATVLTVGWEDNGASPDFECEGVSFQNGSAQSGGGVYLSSLTGAITFTDNHVSGNHANEFGGGAVISSNGTITLTGNTFFNNQSDYYGAGASIHGSGDGEGTLVMSGNTVSGNAAQGAAGGLWTGCGSVTLVNNLFYGNRAQWYHGAVLIDGSDSVSVVNNTISANYAEGRGAGLTIQQDHDTDQAVIHNNILYGNNGHFEANDLMLSNDSDANGAAASVSLLNNDLDQSSAGLLMDLAFSVDPSNLNNQNPLFKSPTTGDYSLAKGSPCIDSGTSSNAPSMDFSGNSRPMGRGYDMGAHEYAGAPIPDIKANSQDGPVMVASGASVAISLGLDPDNLAGQGADWWLIHQTPDGGFSYYDLSAGSMVSGFSPTFQGNLFNLSNLPILTLSAPASGAHVFYFGVDLNPNGVLDVGALYFDIVRVTVAGP